MLDYEVALSRILEAIPSPQIERIRLADATGRVLMESVVSEIDLPLFDNSAMDGYAVRSIDLGNATRETPVRLGLRTRIPAGETFTGELGVGECARLFTGSPVPRGADAVVMQEDVRVEEGGAAAGIYFNEAVQPGENVRRQGEDIRRGTMLIDAGDILKLVQIGLLAATGTAEVVVGRRPVVALLATGSELRELGQVLSPGQIYESNRAALAALIAGSGAVPKLFPIVPDNLEATRKALEEAFKECNAVVSCGGVSVGEMDFVKAAFEMIGGELQFWKIAMRPGKPFVFGRVGRKFFFGLPGNPVSAWVTCALLVCPALRRWQGANEPGLPTQSGVLAEPVSNQGDRRHFARVRVDGEGKVSLAGKQASHVLSSLGDSDGLIDLPPRSAFAAGTKVSLLRWP